MDGRKLVKCVPQYQFSILVTILLVFLILQQNIFFTGNKEFSLLDGTKSLVRFNTINVGLYSLLLLALSSFLYIYYDRKEQKTALEKVFTVQFLISTIFVIVMILLTQELDQVGLYIKNLSVWLLLLVYLLLLEIFILTLERKLRYEMYIDLVKGLLLVIGLGMAAVLFTTLVVSGTIFTYVIEMLFSILILIQLMFSLNFRNYKLSNTTYEVSLRIFLSSLLFVNTSLIFIFQYL